MEEMQLTDTLGSFRERMFDSVIPMDELEPALLKILPFWRKRELLPFFQKGKWARVSFVQYFWLRILEILREFGYTVENMKKVTDYFFRDAYFHDLPKKNMEFAIQQLEMRERAGTISDQEQHSLDVFHDRVNDDVFLHGMKFHVSYLSNLILHCISSRQETAILVFVDGTVGELAYNRYGNHNNIAIDATRPHIYVSIVNILREMLGNDVISDMLLPQILNDDELMVLRELKRKNVSEIVVQLQGGKVKKIESTKEGLISPEEALEIKEILGLYNYESIVLSTKNEKTLSFKRTRKKVIK